MRYLRRTLNCLERIALSNLTRMISRVNHVTIGVEILRIDIGCFLDKEFTELIRMNPLMIIINQLSIKLIYITIVYVVI